MEILLILAILLALSVLVFVLRSEYEKRHPVPVAYTAESEALPASFDGFRLLFLSDLHGTTYGKKQAAFEKMLSETPCDAVLIGGDMVTCKSTKKEELQTLRALFSHLPKGVPVYYGRGNHEMRMWKTGGAYEALRAPFLSLLSEYGVMLLPNTGAELVKDGERIRISGLEVEEKHYGPGKKVPLSAHFIEDKIGEKKDLYEIVLLHSPLYMNECAGWGADLVLSGHFHGGTVYLGKTLGGLMTPQYQLFSRDCRGMRQYGKMTGIVSAGLGTHSINIRFNNKPELITVTLKRTEHAD